MSEQCELVIVGAGQAGLSLSYQLSQENREHLVLESGRIAQSWRSRWDSFCLVLPNWTVNLPGHPYVGASPDGFMNRQEIVDHFSQYSESFSAPIREGVTVNSLERNQSKGFRLQSSEGEITAASVVVATGGFQKPYFPAAVAELPSSLLVIAAGAYTNPASLPPGKVLIIGSGQTGCQLAEELQFSGRQVVLACGRAPWQPRRIGDRDSSAWVMESPLMKMTLADLPNPMARLAANPQASGKDGGHDLHYRTLQTLGVQLVGHLLGADQRFAYFASDLADSVAFGDARYQDLCNLVTKSAMAKGIPVPDLPTPTPFMTESISRVSLTGFSTVLVTTGFRPDYASWVHLPEAFDPMGFPLQQDGTSLTVPGLHFMGVHFQRNRASASLYGVGADAQDLVRNLIFPPGS